ncbi:MAG TPA: FAD-binding oxidoreductase [Deltaproteobacteria bacterium]|nr:FAD-binding oxidoreductase [Deltaproteobacteria bacterium]
MNHFDFIVIGGGIAGASVAWELQRSGSTLLLEREPLPGHHTTGRSAAFLVDSYAGPVVGKLTRAGRSFFETPPEGFTEAPLVTPNAVLWIGRDDQRESLEKALRTGREAGAGMEPVTLAEARKLCPVLREEYVAGAIVEPSALHIDVAGLLESFLRAFRRLGGRVETKSGVERLERKGDSWEVDAGGRMLRARVIVNAAGAWCDEVGRLAGARSIGLRPLRRTAITFDGPPGVDTRTWPLVMDADEDFYFKPEGAQLLASPCDETPSPPCDASPDDYDVALAADAVQRATTLEIRHIRNRWAGLRSFVADRSPVIGMEPECEGFFWLAGQGGFGIMTSPAAARAAAGLIVNGVLPDDLSKTGLTAEMLSPARLRRG